MSGSRLSVHPLNVRLKATDDAEVLLWGDRQELRRALADARARLAGLEAQLADRARTDACTGLLTLEADGTVSTNAEYYTIGHLSKFVRPGAVRIASTSFGTVGNCALPAIETSSRLFSMA